VARVCAKIVLHIADIPAFAPSAEEMILSKKQQKKENK
jgi:hypothetical protein